MVEAIASLAWAQALLKDAPRPEPAERFSGIQKYSWDDLSQEFLESQKTAPGLDLFKMNTMNKINTEDVDVKIKELKDKKMTMYADTLKRAKANNMDIDPKELHTYAKEQIAWVDNEISYRSKEKKNRLTDADKEAETQYVQLADQFIYARSNQQSIQDQIDQEVSKPQSDPVKITKLMEDKQKADKEFNVIKKQFGKAGIEQPEVLLRKYADQPSAEKEIPTTEVFTKLAYNQYSDDKGTFKITDFVGDLMSTPDFKWLSSQESSTKLLDMTEGDENAMKEAVYISQNIMNSSMVPELMDRWYDVEEAWRIALQAHIDNIGKTMVWETLQKIADEMMINWLSKKETKRILKELGARDKDKIEL